MKFYSKNDNRSINADPCSVDIGRYNLSCVDDDSFPFILTTNGLVFGEHTEQHDSLYSRIKMDTVILEGRFWEDSGVIAVWMLGFRYGERSGKVLQFVYQIANEISRRLKYDKRRMKFVYQTAVPANTFHDKEYFAVQMSIGEVGMCMNCGDLSEFLWSEMDRQRRLSRGVNGFSNRDFWRHYEVVGESIKLDRNDLRYIVEKVIKEYKQIPLQK